MKPTQESASRWTRRGLVRAASIAGVALGAGAALGYAVSHERLPAPPGASSAPSAMRAQASAEELAILAPLKEGSTLGGFEVAEIDPVGGDGVLRIVCAKQGARVRLDVSLAVDGGPPPPAVAGRYAIFYALEKAVPADGERLALALAAILQTNATAPTPQGLGQFIPQQH